MSFTIHGVDRELDDKLTERARRERISKNRLVKIILSQAMGLAGPNGEREDYREFLGAWSSADKAIFEEAQIENQRVDGNDWE